MLSVTESTYCNVRVILPFEKFTAITYYIPFTAIFKQQKLDLKHQFQTFAHGMVSLLMTEGFSAPSVNIPSTDERSLIPVRILQ